MTRKEEIEQASIEYHTKPHHEAVKDDFLRGAEWADKTMLDKVCEWIETNTNKINLKGGICLSSKQFIEELKQAMEE